MKKNQAEKKLPDVYYFNPTCEYAVANGNKSWQPNRLLQKMEEDLCLLPQYLAQPEDVILVKKMPDEKFLNSLRSVGIQVPELVLLPDVLTDKNFLNRPKNKLLPWGWSPAVHHLLDPLKNSCSADFKHSPVASWKNQQRELYSKKFALKILKQVLRELNSEVLLPQHLIAGVCKSRSDFERLLSRWGKIMVKAPWSSSGRGLQPVTKTPVHPKVWEKLMGIVNEQGYAVTEPLLNKKLDMAFQFEMLKGKVTFKGTSYFQTDSKGQYQKNFLNGLPKFLAEETGTFARKANELIIPSLINNIEKSELAKNYEGYFGVDTLIFSDEKNRLRINPCLEINVRQNMGLLSLNLASLSDSTKKGYFSIRYQPGQSFQTFAEEMQKVYPLRLNRNKIESGFLALTPATENALFGAYLLF
ncbi:MAG: hypothetical protein ACOC1D_01130 [Prolixibacteraceae bacterium]